MEYKGIIRDICGESGIAKLRRVHNISLSLINKNHFATGVGVRTPPSCDFRIAISKSKMGSGMVLPGCISKMLPSNCDLVSYLPVFISFFFSVYLHPHRPLGKSPNMDKCLPRPRKCIVVISNENSQHQTRFKINVFYLHLHTETLSSLHQNLSTAYLATYPRNA